MALGAAIRALLVADGTVSGLVSTRIYPQVMPGHITGDAIAYAINSNDRNQSKDGSSQNIKGRFSISIWSSTYTTANSIADACINVLDNYKGTSGGLTIQRMYIDDEGDATWNEETGFHEVQQDYFVTYNK